MSKFIILCLCFISVTAIAQTSKWQDYKCHITSSVGERILFYRWKVEDAKWNQATLSGSQFKDGKSGTKYFIKEVSECLSLDDTFKLKSAQELDSVTLR